MSWFRNTVVIACAGVALVVHELEPAHFAARGIDAQRSQVSQPVEGELDHAHQENPADPPGHGGRFQFGYAVTAEATTIVQSASGR